MDIDDIFDKNVKNCPCYDDGLCRMQISYDADLQKYYGGCSRPICVVAYWLEIGLSQGVDNGVSDPEGV